MLQAAEKGLHRYLTMLNRMSGGNPDSSLTDLGLAPDSLDKEMLLGTPFQACDIDRETLLAYDEGTSIDTMIHKTNLWYFPVYIDGEAKTSLLVDKMDGSWKAVAFGMAPVAREMGKILKAWPNDKGFTPQLVRYGYVKQFFHIPQYDNDNLTEISFSDETSDYAVLDNADSAIGILKNSISETE